MHGKQLLPYQVPFLLVTKACWKTGVLKSLALLLAEILWARRGITGDVPGMLFPRRMMGELFPAIGAMILCHGGPAEYMLFYVMNPSERIFPQALSVLYWVKLEIWTSPCVLWINFTTRSNGIEYVITNGNVVDLWASSTINTSSFLGPP